MSDPIYGVIHGKRIELQTDPGLVDGQPVEVFVRPSPLLATDGSGLRRSAGALADDPHWDAIMDEIQQTRKQDRRSPEEAE